MSSIIQGYEYDIFISYRQKDNKGDRWVSEFVDNLKEELESTFKEEISVYFDINPHDGLLETHDVDASLKEKLRCFIFLPIISRTYCDPKSFAWEHEFKAFIEQASRDQYGLKIKLSNGNVASRVLPVRIRDLDVADIKLCESVLGGVIRGIDFVYKEIGVNRPLTPEDDENKNLNNTRYRNQINKTANAIREIISGLISEPEEITKDKIQFPESWEEVNTDYRRNEPPTTKMSSRRSIRRLGMMLLMTLCVIGAFAIYKFYTQINAKMTIAVIPYTYPSNDYKLAEYGIGAMDAIITKLQEVKRLSVRHRVYSIQYLDTKKTLEELRNELKVNYLVEISIRKNTDNLKMGVVLRETKGNKQLWGDQYDINEENLMPLFSEIAQIIARNLNVHFST
jgi:TolB-like protein